MREKELQGNLPINEYMEIESGYSVKDSTKEYERQLKENQNNFAIGEPLLFSAENAKLSLPVLKDKDGKPIKEIDDNGNEIFVRDDDGKPYVKFINYDGTKKAVAIVYASELCEMLEKLQSNLKGKQARAVADVLDIVFPKSVVNFGTFKIDGKRELQAVNFHYLQQSALFLYTLPIMEKDKNGLYTPKIRVFTWIDVDDNGNKTEREITICHYHGKQIDGAQIGYNESKKASK